MQTTLEAGLYYLQRGFPVFPFKRDKSQPCVKWEQYQEFLPSKDDVTGWFTRRFCNEFIAIVTGKYSGLMVVDCDSQTAYDKIQEYIPPDLLTPVAKTSRGYHVYFKYRPGLVSKAKYMQDTDVKTDGGCIIAPPSKNGHGVEYKWLPGRSIEKVDPAPIPEELYILLKQFLSIGSYEETKPQEVTPATNGNILFNLGSRDQDIFHVANCLVKGGCEISYTSKVLEILAKNCTPPFDEKEIPAKIHSALSRKSARERNLAYEVKEWVATTNGNFSTTEIHKELHLTTKDEKKNLNMILKRLAEGKPPMIEKAGNVNGIWRLIDQDCIPEDWINADCEYKNLWLPLGLGEICGVQPGNILIFAGAKDSGKTAFLMNISKENRHKYKVHYFNSEMGKQEFKLRASKFDDISINQWNNFCLYTRSSNFQDVIKKGEGNLNVIDYLEAPEEAYRIGPMIKRIHDRLEGALCVIGLQKKIGQDLGRGAEFSMEKSRLYVSLDFGKAKIVSCKNFKENEIISGNPRGYTCRYKLVNGCKIIKQAPGWTSPAERTEK